MAIIKCSECTRDISNKAPACPHCGVKISATVKKNGCSSLVLVLFFGAIYCYAMVHCSVDGNNSYRPSVESSQSIDHNQLTPEQEALKKKKNRELTAASMAVALIKKSLRDPNSFILESVLVTDLGAVCIEFRSNNGFGGVNHIMAAWSQDRTNFKTSEMDGFTRLWNKDCAEKPASQYVKQVQAIMKYSKP